MCCETMLCEVTLVIYWIRIFGMGHLQVLRLVIAHQWALLKFASWSMLLYLTDAGSWCVMWPTVSILAPD